MNPWTLFRSVPLHHTEPADPDLLEWIKGFLDHLIHLGPWTIVAVLALLILLMPVAIISVYLIQQRRHSSTGTSSHEERDS